MVDTQRNWGDTWRSSPIVVHRGPIEEVMAYVPSFERRDFTAGHGRPEARGRNPRLDTIVRLPLPGEHEVVPVGVVSKGYTLVPHREVLELARTALGDAGIPLDEVEATVTLTEYGERMALSLCLPERYQFNPGDGHPMALRLECFNSVDGSLRFRALMGWFRFVCSNGLVIGVTMRDVSCRHMFELPVAGLEVVLRAGLECYERERDLLARWRDRAVTVEQVERWANTQVRDAWGVKAAVRTYHIARSGRDVDVVGPYRRMPPSRVPTTPACPVPGTPPRTGNVFDVSQVLAWLAKERRDVAEQLEWREEIPELLAALEAA